MLLALTLTAGCQGTTDGVLFKDVSQRPPDALPETREAIKRDRVFGEWVLYQDGLCDAFGCVQ